MFLLGGLLCLLALPLLIGGFVLGKNVMWQRLGGAMLIIGILMILFVR